MGLPQRGKPVVNSQPDIKTWVDAQFKANYPSLYAFLKDEVYDNGNARKPGTISLFCKMGGLTMAINDHDRGLVAFVNQHTWEEALDVVEMGITEDKLDWKMAKYAVAGKNPPF